ncbi:diaminobutyrate-pyruvate transaminase & L-2,4-diaminobutyrate decarboxylase domain protein [Vibrio parahaemolyticus AQ3810]|nr:diaminobutyrate-pyruvate transaminase & L-2,4-diaminobutyrate decarboxylase domain protein [Vibrio parahaemolyticus AQ3810]
MKLSNVTTLLSMRTLLANTYVLVSKASKNVLTVLLKFVAKA